MSRTHYLQELDSVRQNLIQMGETTIELFDEALRAISEPNPASAARASELEAKTDHQHRLIHDQCLNLITLQAPVARDARLVTGVLDAIVDLELIGDYTYEMVTLASSLGRRPPHQILAQMSEVAAKVRGVLAAAIDSWRDDAAPQRFSARPQESVIRDECRSIYEKLSRLTAAPGDATMYVDLMLMARHLERILRHSICVADQAAGAAPIDQAQGA